MAEEERRLVTVLICDLSGFTALSERLDPEEAREVVQAFFGRAVAVIESHGGRVANFIGDEVCALFGTGSEAETAAGRACRCALALRAEMEPFNAALAGGPGGRTLRAAAVADPLSLHAGIHTGLAVLGTVGAGEASLRAAVGDVVNTASRLMTAAAPGEILVSGPTLRATRGRFDFDEPRELRVKGKRRALDAACLLRERSPDHPAAAAEGRFVGRERELSLLRSAVDAVRSGEARCIAVDGEAGIGKSRLVREAESGPPGGAGPAAARWLRAACPRPGEAMDSAAAQTVLSACSLTARSGAQERRAALEQRCAPEAGGPHAENLPFLARFIGAANSEEEVRRLDASGDAYRTELQLAYARFFVALAARGPLVLCVEDVHWCDEDSAALLSRLAARIRESPVLLLLTLRRAEGERGDELLGEIARHLPLERVGLLGVSLRSVGEMVAGRLGVPASSVPESVVRLVSDRTAGNALFAGELATHLVETGAVSVVDGDVHLVREASGIPLDVWAVIQARLDRLAPAVRRTLQRAAVLGTRFDAALLPIVEPEAGLGARLALAGSAGLVRPSEEPGYWEFRHALVRDASYESVLLRDRRAMHCALAEHVESSVPPGAAWRVEFLAEHFDRAEIPEKAFRYLREASWNAERAGRCREGLALAERALAIPELPSVTADDRIAAAIRRGWLLDRLSRFEESGQTFAALLGRSPLAVREAEVRHALASSLRRRDRYGEALAVLESVPVPADDATAANVLTNRGIILHKLGRLEESETDLRRALDVAVRWADRAHEGVACNALGELLSDRGRDEDATAFLLRALEIVRLTENRVGEAAVSNNLANKFLKRGRPAEAESLLRRALELNRASGNRHFEAANLNGMALLHRLSGRHEAAAGALAAARRLNRATGNVRWESMNLGGLGMARLDQGRFSEALAALELAERGYGSVGATLDLTYVSAARAQVLCAVGVRASFEEALRCLSEAPGGEDPEDPALEAYARAARTAALVGLGRAHEAAPEIPVLLECGDRARPDWKSAPGFRALALAAALFASGRGAEAEEECRSLEESARRIGAPSVQAGALLLWASGGEPGRREARAAEAAAIAEGIGARALALDAHDFLARLRRGTGDGALSARARAEELLAAVSPDVPEEYRAGFIARYRVPA